MEGFILNMEKHITSNFGLYLNSDCKYYKLIHAINNTKLHSHDYYEIIFTPHHKITHYINGETQELPAGSIIFIRPDDYHDISNPNKSPMEVHFFAFTKKMLHEILEFLSSNTVFPSLSEAKLSPHVVLTPIQIHHLIFQINQLNAVDISIPNYKSIQIRSILTYIFTTHFIKNYFDIQNKIPDWLINVRAEMENIDNFSLGVNRMAELSNFSQGHLSRMMQKYYGETTIDFINNLRLSYIANGLINSNESIITLSCNCGYNNLSWMYTLFKKKYGVSPAKFREQYIKKTK